MKYILRGFAAALAVAAAAIATPAAAAPARHHAAVLCDRAACATITKMHRGARLRTGDGTHLRPVAVGTVTARWPFRHGTELGADYAGRRVVQLHLTSRLCVGDGMGGWVKARPCSRQTLWVRAGLGFIGVRASDVPGLPCFLAPVTWRHRTYLSALIELSDPHWSLRWMTP